MGKYCIFYSTTDINSYLLPHALIFYKYNITALYKILELAPQPNQNYSILSLLYKCKTKRDKGMDKLVSFSKLLTTVWVCPYPHIPKYTVHACECCAQTQKTCVLLLKLDFDSRTSCNGICLHCYIAMFSSSTWQEG